MPDDVPIPVPRPDVAPAHVDKPKDDAKKALPDQSRPADTTTDEAKEPLPDQSKPADKTTDEAKEPLPDQSKPADTTEVYVPPPIEKEDPEQFKTCLAQLATLGVEYKEATPTEDGIGCGIDRPITVSALGQGIALSPPGEMRCEAALELTRWTTDVVVPMLKTAMPGETLAGLDQASAYVCRKRNNATVGKISEHAHGNAVDIAGFRFKSGARFDIKPRMQDSTLDGAFQRAITSAACLYFTTVLDPGSDKAHETHLHLDVLKRKAGYRLLLVAGSPDSQAGNLRTGLRSARVR